MYLDQNTAPFFSSTGYQPFGDPSANQGDPDTDMLRAERFRRQMAATPTRPPGAADMNVSEPSLWGQALGQGPAAQQPQQQQPQLGGPGLNIDQLAAKGINVPETRQAFSGTDLVSTMRSPGAGGYRAGEMLSKETTTPMDDISIARRMRGTNMGSLSRYMPEAVQQSNKLIEEMGKQQTARDVEKDKYAAELAKLDTAESKQYSHEDALTHAQAVRDYQKKYPKATLEEAQQHADEQVAINQQGRRVAGIGIKRSRVPGAATATQPPGASGAPSQTPPPPPAGKTLKTEQQRALAAEIFPTPGEVNPSSLRHALPGYESRLRDPGSLEAVSDHMVEGGGGNMGALDTLGQDYIRKAIAQGITSHDTPFGTVSTAPAMEDVPAGGNMFGGVSGKGKRQSGYHLMLNGQPIYHVPSHKIDTGGLFTPGTFSSQDSLDREAATNPTVAAMLAPILRNIRGQ